MGVSMRALLSMFAVFAVSGAARGEGPTVDRIVADLEGVWSNTAQYAAAPDALKVEPSVDGDWLDLQHAEFHRIEAPMIGERVLYLEWRRGAADGPISRQRLWSFRTDADGTVRMDFYAFIDGASFAGRGAEPGAFANLDASALRSYGPDCALRFDASPGGGWVGRITGDQCRIVAASGRQMGIDATIQFGTDGVLSYQEAGRLDDGRYAFRVPPTMPYRFVPASHRKSRSSKPTD
jgi:hypothetical protein